MFAGGQVLEGGLVFKDVGRGAGLSLNLEDIEPFRRGPQKLDVAARQLLAHERDHLQRQEPAGGELFDAVGQRVLGFDFLHGRGLPRGLQRPGSHPKPAALDAKLEQCGQGDRRGESQKGPPEQVVARPVASAAGDPVVRGLTFTGSRDTGARIYARATEHFARVQLEMGGKNPLVVLADAELDKAIEHAVNDGLMVVFFLLTGYGVARVSSYVGSTIDLAEQKQRRAEEALSLNLSELHAAYEQLTSSDEELRHNYGLLAEREQALRENEKKYHDLAELLPQMIFETDLELRITYANRHAFTELGFTGQDLEHGRCWDRRRR